MDDPRTHGQDGTGNAQRQRRRAEATRAVRALRQQMEPGAVLANGVHAITQGLTARPAWGAVGKAVQHLGVGRLFASASSAWANLVGARATAGAREGVPTQALHRWEDEGGPEPLDALAGPWLEQAVDAHKQAAQVRACLDQAAQDGLLPSTTLDQEAEAVAAMLEASTRRALALDLDTTAQAARAATLAARERALAETIKDVEPQDSKAVWAQALVGLAAGGALALWRRPTGLETQAVGAARAACRAALVETAVGFGLKAIQDRAKDGTGTQGNRP